MSKDPLQIPLKKAAQLLGVRDSRTIRKYGKEGRIRINGTGNGQKVVLASIYAYLDGKSEWHAKRQSHDASQAPALSDSSAAGRSHGKLRPHDLRHTALTILALHGVPANVRKALSGHSTAKMDELYTSHAAIEDIRRALG